MNQQTIEPVPRHSPRQLIVPLALIAGVMLLGTVGYTLVEGWSLQDALWMTVITMTTIGYGEVNPLSSAGRWFTIGLIFLSISVAGYAIARLTTFVVEGELNRMFQARRMDQRITAMKDHFIVCGGGHVGRHIASEFVRTGTPFVVIEPNVDVAQQLEQMGDILYIKGDPTQNNTLLQAQIQFARGLITTFAEDKENIFIVLTARALSPTLRIVTRVIHDENEEKLRLAGANEIISTDAIGGLRIASIMLRPGVVSFLDDLLAQNGDMALEEISITEKSHLAGKSIGEIHQGLRDGIAILAHRQGERTTFRPDPSARLAIGDVLFVVGHPSDVAGLRRE